VREKVIADFHAAVDGDKAVENGVIADRDILVDKAIRADVCTGANACGFCNDCGGMNARGVGRRLIKKLDSVREGEIWVAGTQCGEGRKAGFAFNANTFLDEDGGSARGMEQREVAAIGEESDLSWCGVVHSRDAGDFDGGIAFETAGKFLCDVREFH